MLLNDYLKAVTRSPGVYNDAYNGPGVVDADIDISQIEALPGERAIVLHVRGDSFSERQSLQQDVVLVIDLHDKAVVQLSWDTETELVVLVLLELVFERAERVGSLSVKRIPFTLPFTTRRKGYGPPSGLSIFRNTVLNCLCRRSVS